MSLRDPLPGSFFLTEIGGVTGKWVGVGQALAGRPSRWSHAGIVGPNGQTVEAMPGGAVIGSMANLLKKPHLICDGPIQMGLKLHPFLAEEQLRSDVVNRAFDLVGTPYSFLDYVALAAEHLHMPSEWVRNRVETSGHLICSALVDRAYSWAGIHLFDDGRLPGDVMPSDLGRWHDEWEAQQ